MGEETAEHDEDAGDPHSLEVELEDGDGEEGATDYPAEEGDKGGKPCERGVVDQELGDGIGLGEPGVAAGGAGLADGLELLFLLVFEGCKGGLIRDLEGLDLSGGAFDGEHRDWGEEAGGLEHGQGGAGLFGKLGEKLHGLGFGHASKVIGEFHMLKGLSGRSLLQVEGIEVKSPGADERALA